MIKVFAHWITVLVAHGIAFTTRLSQLLWTSTDEVNCCGQVQMKLSVGTYNVYTHFGCLADTNKWEVPSNRI